MKRISRILPCLALVVSTAPAFAAATKTYQVTGPVLAVDETTVTVEKGKEKWTLQREAATAISGGELKVGDKVTITYKMVATDIENKGAAGAKKK